MSELTVKAMARRLKDNRGIPCPRDSSKCFVDNHTPAEIRCKFAELEGGHE